MKKSLSVVMVGLILGAAWASPFLHEPDPDPVKTSNLRVSQIAGLTLFEAKECSKCHTTGATTNPKLTPIPNMRDEAWFKQHVQQESKLVLRPAKSKRKQRRVLKDELAALVDYLYTSKAAEKKQIDSLPADVRQGAYLVYQNNCLNCHSIAGVGKEVAPDLTYVAHKHGDKTWLIQNLQDPQQFKPESLMPKFDLLPADDLARIAEYLLTLRK